MSPEETRYQRLWWAVATAALAFVIAAAAARIRHVVYVTDVAGRSAAEISALPTDRPELIVPGHHSESFEWLDQTRQMFSLRQLRVRRIDYENAPFGRAVFAMSPYRWWLGLLAVGGHLAFGQPIDRAVELAVLYADPLLQVLLLTAVAWGVARRFGALAAATAAAGLAAFYPLASEYQPGMPDSRGLALAIGLGGVLLLLAGAGRPASAALRWFIAAGATAALGLWVSPGWATPLVLGCAVGGLLQAAAIRPQRDAPDLPWRAWGAGGAMAILLAYLLEFFPHDLGGWEFRVIHPLFGLAWLGLGDVVARLAGMIRGRKPVSGWLDGIMSVLALFALASLPVAMVFTHNAGFLGLNLDAMRLTILPGAPSAPSLVAWLLQNGVTFDAWATLLPLVVLLPAAVLVFWAPIEPPQRALILLAMGPVFVAVALAIRQVSWWNGVDAALVVLLVACASAARALPVRPVILTAFLVLAPILTLGAFALWPTGAAASGQVAQAELEGLVERDFAAWMSQHIRPEDVVLAPPNITVALHYYAGIRGLGTFGWEDTDGLTAAVRMVSATTPEESLELFGRRGVRYIVIPSWDPYMDVYARMGEGQLEGTFLERLYHWVLPPWLRPVPYLIPTIPGFEGQSVTVLEVVDEQDPASAATRLADYFVAMGQMDLAANAGLELRKYPADLGALLGRAEVAVAQGDSGEAARLVEQILHRSSGGADHDLPWDERVTLAITLAQTHHLDAARDQLKGVLTEIDDEKLRSLTTTSLYRLEVLRRALGLEIADPRLRDLALALLPADFRTRLSK